MPYVLMLAILFVGGVFRSLQAMAMNALAFADLDSRQMSHATSFSTMAQRLSQSMGVASAAALLHVASGPGGALHLGAFEVAFVAIGIIAAMFGPDLRAASARRRRRARGRASRRGGAGHSEDPS